MNINVENSFKFIAPFTMIVAGCTMSGKTQLVKSYVSNANQIISPPPKKIVISYTENQPAYEELSSNISNVELVEGLNFDISDFDSSIPSLLVIDDQMLDVVKSKKIVELFTKGVHHRGVSVIILQQNIFPQGKHGRDIRLNSHYITIMKSPTFLSQVNCLGRQIFPNNPNFLSISYKKATEKPYSYLFLNLHPLCDDKLRVSEGILQNHKTVFYIPE